MLAPRDTTDQSAPASSYGDVPTDVAIAVAVPGLPLLADPHRLSAAELLVGSLLPSRPARVLFGVWRN